MDLISFKGTVQYVNLETGFWGIIDSTGKKWLPFDLDDEFKKEGLTVNVKAEKVDAVTTLMWGTPIEIIEID